MNMSLKNDFLSVFLVVILLFTFVHKQGVAQSGIDYADLFICTAGDHGQLDPAATAPFGMIKLGPDTDPINHSGYNYDATKIKGFSHNRVGGTGCLGAGGNLRFLPIVGNPNIASVVYVKASEKASPGYYTVALENQVLAEFTATNNTGIHKYTFPKTDSAYLKIDCSSSFAKLIKASKNILNDREFTAEISAQNVCNFGRYTVYYHVWCNKSFKVENDKNQQFSLRFKTQKDEQIIFYVTCSSLSVEDAKQHFVNKSKNLKFEEVAKQTKQQWAELLSRIQVEGNTEYKKIFYTHLYHQFLNPVKTENDKKQFKATNGDIYVSDNYTHYDTWSMWDNYRNKFPLIALISPSITKDFANSLVDLYKYGRPNWSSFYEPAPTVRTEHSIIALLDFYQRGITDFDLALVYKRACAEIDNDDEKSPDKKLEKSYDYWALSQIAKILKKVDDAQLFDSLARTYKDIWKKKFLPITEQSDIMHAAGLYEGTLWQYRWHVQFDVQGMIDLIGSKEKYTEQLEYFFDNHLYNHGNQPDIHVPFMFNYSTKPYLTQKWVNMILTKEMRQDYGTHHKWKTPYMGRIYKSEPAGYIPEMDDDEGTMSAWYVLSSMGLYSVLVGSPEYQLTSPIFDKIVIKLENNKTFEIIAENLSDKSFYIQSVTFNGKPHNQTSISHKDITNGGKLVFKLAEEPNLNWGK